MRESLGEGGGGGKEVHFPYTRKVAFSPSIPEVSEDKERERSRKAKNERDQGGNFHSVSSPLRIWASNFFFLSNIDKDRLGFWPILTYKEPEPHRP